MSELVVLVNENDVEIGTAEKMKAHRESKLHRAFSVFVVNSKNEMLLQKRAHHKYHSGGLWTNTCCSHPRAGEKTDKAAHRRLQEEMGFDSELNELFTFLYKAKLDNELTEHELDHVFWGEYNGEVMPDPDEVDQFKWIDIQKLKQDIQQHPELYTVWFKIAFGKLLDKKIIV